MNPPIRERLYSLRDRLRESLGRKGTGFVLALAIEILLVLVLLTLGQGVTEPQGERPSLSSFTLSGEETAEQQDDSQQAEENDTAAPEPRAQAKPEDQPDPPEPVPDTPKPEPVVPIPQAPPAPEFELNTKPRPKAPAAVAKPGVKMGPQLGPLASSPPGDTARMGTAPNGEPMYAAQWYREPYDDELAGYLQTASGPGWGLIACRTAKDFRVEDCEIVDEYPRGSNIARAVKAAAWQFRVRPPRLKGQYMVGSWVGIRIDYQRRGP